MNLSEKLQQIVVKFCNDISFEDLRKLAIYLGSGITQNEKPTKIEEDFCKKFLGDVRYAEYLTHIAKQGNTYFSNAKAIGYEINELYTYVSFQCVLRSSDLLIKISKNNLEKAKLKRDILKAVINSYDDDNTFYKVDGWSNISEVLVKYELLTLPED